MMSTMTIAVGSPTLADRLFSRTLALDLVLVAAGAALTSVAAQIAVPLWPVPITMQTLAVLLVGVSLGAVRGALSMVLYAVLGIVGLPVFSDASSGFGVIAGPTGGYIVGFIFAAAFTGWLAQRQWDRKWLRSILAFLGGTVVVFAIGLPWLGVALGALGAPNDLGSVLQGGLYPFIIGGIVKALLAAGIIGLSWRAIAHADAQRARRAAENSSN
jgi:biotin transport system substrate-specific component